jgi:putative endonuclease
MAAFVYVLLSRTKSKRTYVGWTLDLERRVEQHNGGKGAKFTRGGKWVLIYAERHRTRNGAMRREVFLKRDKAFRAALRQN